MTRAALIALLLTAGAAAAADLNAIEPPEGAVETHFAEYPRESYRLPVHPFTESRRPAMELEGQLSERVLRIDDAGSAGSLEALRRIEAQLVAKGYETIFDCAAASCGGFDFRFGVRVVPAPKMEVSLGDFRFLAAKRFTGAREDYVTVLTSRIGGKLFIQLIALAAGDPAAAPAAGDEAHVDDLAALIARRFAETGRSILDNVEFVSGSAELSSGAFPMLAALAKLMAETPGLNVAIVGHTDSRGDPARNQHLSEERASAVVARLVERHGVAADRLSAHGVGSLAPVAPNDTDDGRARNRRVEATPR